MASERTFINPKDGAEMIRIPAGEFLMGDDKRKVTLPEYAIYKTPVTVAQYEAFCNAMKRQMPPEPDYGGQNFNPGWSKKDHPVVNVSWHDAMAHCQWAGVSLPTEAQWEKAARGTNGQEYPWKGGWDADKCHCSKQSWGDSGGTTAVGSYPQGRSPYQVLDMAGNVWEWCSGWHDTEEKCHPLRGGSWISNAPNWFRCAHRARHDPDFRYNLLGFRCVWCSDS